MYKLSCITNLNIKINQRFYWENFVLLMRIEVKIHLEEETVIIQHYITILTVDDYVSCMHAYVKSPTINLKN